MFTLMFPFSFESVLLQFCMRSKEFFSYIRFLGSNSRRICVFGVLIVTNSFDGLWWLVSTNYFNILNFCL